MIQWHKMADEAPEFPRADAGMVTCIVVTDRGEVMALDWCRYQYAKTERGRAPRWNWHGQGAYWTVEQWAYLPAAPHQGADTGAGTEGSEHGMGIEG